MAEMSWAYVAGFIDGEGSFSIATYKYCFMPRLSISQGQVKVLKEIQSFFAQRGIRSSLYRDLHKPRGNVWYNLRVQDRSSLANICSHLSGLLRVKRDQLAVMVRLLSLKSGHITRTDKIQQQLRRAESDQCRKEIMELNRRREVA